MSGTQVVLFNDQKNVYLAYGDNKLQLMAAKGPQEKAAKKITDTIFGAGTPVPIYDTTDEKDYRSYKACMENTQKDIQAVLKCEGKVEEKKLKHKTRVYKALVEKTKMELTAGIVEGYNRFTGRKSGITKIVAVSEKELKKGLKDIKTKYDGIALSKDAYKVLKALYKK